MPDAHGPHLCTLLLITYCLPKGREQNSCLILSQELVLSTPHDHSWLLQYHGLFIKHKESTSEGSKQAAKLHY